MAFHPKPSAQCSVLELQCILKTHRSDKIIRSLAFAFHQVLFDELCEEVAAALACGIAADGALENDRELTSIFVRYDRIRGLEAEDPQPHKEPQPFFWFRDFQ